MELNRSKLSRGICALLVLLATTPARPCGQGSGTPEIPPTLGGTVLAPLAMNSAGEFTGYSGVAGDVAFHSFLYHNGSPLDVGSFDGQISVGFSINASNQITGYSSVPDGSQHAFLWSGGNLVDVGTLGGGYSQGNALNDFGVVVGFSGTTNGEEHAFAFGSSTITDLGTLGGSYSSANAINNSGAIVGYAETSNFFSHAFLYSGGIMIDLGTLGGDTSEATAINNKGQIIGQSETASSEEHAFLYDNDTMVDLGSEGNNSTAIAINSAGKVLFSSEDNAGNRNGFLYSNGTSSSLGTLGGAQTFPHALNNTGVVVGQSELANGSTHAFIWQNGSMLDLNSLIPTNSGWELFDANFISDAGRIVGLGLLNGNSHFFILNLGSANNPPVAIASASLTTIDCQGRVSLDGTGSSDPDGDALTFQWSEAGNILGTNSTLNANFDLGAHTITLTVSDPCGASGQTNIVLQVVDGTAPSIVCPAPSSAQADANCQASVPNFKPNLTINDNCTAINQLVVTQQPAPGTFVGLGSHPVTLTVTDASGNQNSCTTTFTVQDTTAPVIISGPALGNIPVGTNCLALVPNVTSNIVASDNCTPANQLFITQNPAAGSTVGRGPHTIVVTVRDASSNSASGSLTFNAVDTLPPVFVGQISNTITVNVISNCVAAMPSINFNVTDNCGSTNNIFKSQSPAAGTLLGVGSYNVVLTASDASSNSATRTVQLVVRDATAPTFVSLPVPFTLSAGSNCSAALPDITGKVVAFDNCTPANQLVITQNPAPGTVFGVGSYTLAVTVKDAANNSHSNLVSFTVADSTAPTIVSLPGPITVSSGTNCSGIVPNLISNVVAFDDCTPANRLVITQNPLPGTVVSSGHYSITVTVKDASSNSVTGIVSLTVADTTAPMIVSLPAPITISADANCSGAVPNVAGSVVVADNCTPANQLLVTQSPSAGTSVGLGQHAITVTVTDAAGNSSTGTVSFTVVDMTAPTIVSVGAPITVAADANCQAVVPNIITDVVAADNCTPANQLVITQSPAAGTILGHGQYTITVTVKDAAGNTSTSTRLFTVADQTAPVISSVTASPNNLGSPNGAIYTVNLSVLANDNCDTSPVNKIVSITANESVPAGDIQITGNLTCQLRADRNPAGSGRVYTITVESRDNAGNVSTAATTVTVSKGNKNKQ